MLCLDVRASKNIAAQSNLPAVLVSCSGQTLGLLWNTSLPKPSTVIVGQDGSPMGQVITIDQAHTNKTGQRFIRALFFAETGTPLPFGALVGVGSTTDLRPHDSDIQEIARALTKFPDVRDGEIGTTFSYVVGLGPGASVCRSKRGYMTTGDCHRRFGHRGIRRQ